MGPIGMQLARDLCGLSGKKLRSFVRTNLQLFGLHSYPFSKSWFENAENACRGHSNRDKSSPLKTPAGIMGGSVYEVVSETNLPGRIASRVDFRSVLKHSVSVLICENGENGWQNHRFEF